MFFEEKTVFYKFKKKIKSGNFFNQDFLADNFSLEFVTDVDKNWTTRLSLTKGTVRKGMSNLFSATSCQYKSL